MKDFKLVGGYEWPRTQNFCEDAVLILRSCNKHGAAFFEVDDGDHPEVDQLQEVSGEYFTYFNIDKHCHVIVDLERWRVAL